MPGQTARENGKLGGRPIGSVKPRTLAVAKLRDFITTKVTEKATPLLNAKLDLALGVHLGELKKDTGEIVNVYQKAPDGNSIQYLFNQAIGRPKESLEIGGQDGEPFKVQIFPALEKIYGKRAS